MDTSPVPAPSSSNCAPCRLTISLLFSRKEHRANAWWRKKKYLKNLELKY